MRTPAGRPKNKRRKPRYCPDCYSEMVKGGRSSNGKQMWKCYFCGYRTVRPSMTDSEEC